MRDESLPLVSVGLPTFNRDKSLEKSIESVLQQTYENIQLVISDNASTDSTKLICERFCAMDKRVTYIRQNSNSGAVHNFSEVLRFSTGEYFMWLGDDDWLSPSYIAECVNTLIDSPDYSLVAGQAIYFDKGKFSCYGNSISLDQDDRCDRLLSYYRKVTDNGVFYGVMRKSQISQIPVPSVIGGDWLMIASIAFLGKIRTIPHISVNRELSWSVDWFVKLAEHLGLSKFHGQHPYISISLSATNDILRNSQIYESLSPATRVSLSLKVFTVLIFQKACLAYKVTSMGSLKSFAKRIYPC